MSNSMIENLKEQLLEAEVNQAKANVIITQTEAKLFERVRRLEGQTQQVINTRAIVDIYKLLLEEQDADIAAVKAVAALLKDAIREARAAYK